MTIFQRNSKKKRRRKKTWETLDNVLHRTSSKSLPNNDKLSTDKTEMSY